MAELYSVRMRAAQGGPHEKGGHHISGAERIVKLEEVGAIAQSLADHQLATELLQGPHISEAAVLKAISLLKSLDKSMRGAMLVDAITGERLDTGDRGVRVSHMDSFDSYALGDNEHMREALVLASKVQSADGIVGELCWSDDPDYTVGYVACNGVYHRLPNMKEFGSDIGGRVFFVRSDIDSESVIEYLERTPVLVQRR